MNAIQWRLVSRSRAGSAILFKYLLSISVCTKFVRKIEKGFFLYYFHISTDFLNIICIYYCIKSFVISGKGQPFCLISFYPEKSLHIFLRCLSQLAIYFRNANTSTIFGALKLSALDLTCFSVIG